MKHLKYLRMARGLSQQKLAEMLGVSQQSIYKYENDLAQPDFKILTDMADLFHTTLDYLVGYRPDIEENAEIREETARYASGHMNDYEPVVQPVCSPMEAHYLSLYRRAPKDVRQAINVILEEVDK